MRSATRLDGWSTPREALRYCAQQHLLRRTVAVAVVVGVLLSAINQGAVMASGDATTATWFRVFANFVIPFLVSNAGALSAARSSPGG